VTLTAGWWGRFGILCLQLCLVWATTAMASPAQDEQASKNSVTFTTLLNFDLTNGANPFYSYPVQGTDGSLYGTASDGGTGAGCTFSSGCGTVFKITPTGSLTTVYNFCSQTNCTDGGGPVGPLTLGTDGNFYGIAVGGGTGAGTVFKLTPSGALTTLHNWCSQPNCADGSYPSGPFGPPLVQGHDGNFYGTTSGGGTFGAGTVFKIAPEGSLTTLWTFCSQSGCPDGFGPSTLIQATDGNFYGTTYFGGANGDGTLFKITPGGTLTTVYSFCSQGGLGVCTDGAVPFGPPIQAADGNFYGTASGGGTGPYCPLGPNQCGTVFKLTPSGALTTLYSFCSQANCGDGGGPFVGLAQGTDGNFYGTTSVGGANGDGTVFKVTPEGVLTTLHSFDNPYVGGFGGNPVVQATNGNFYGTTLFGGNTNPLCGYAFYGTCGTVFSVSVGLGPFVVTVPTSGKVGTPVTILGNDLADATHVRFGNVKAEFTVVSATEIQTTVPEGATTGFVTVNRHGPRLKSNVQFQVLP
jgi:uncharacterized repeat protein (TIGR03803 family)